MHYYVTYTMGGKFKRIHCPLANKRQIVEHEHQTHDKCIIFFQDDSIYDDYFKGLVGSVWRDKVEQMMGIDGAKFNKLDKSEVEEEWIEKLS